MVEVDAEGGEFAAAGIVLAEAVEAAAEVGGIGGRGPFGAPGLVVGGDGAGGGEEVGEGFVVGAVGGVEGGGGGGGGGVGGNQEGSTSR